MTRKSADIDGKRQVDRRESGEKGDTGVYGQERDAKERQQL